VTTIEESKDLEEMKIEELVGSLQTYEYSLPPFRKVKTITLKASKASKKKSRVSEKKDLRGPQCFECSSFGHIKTKCANLKK
jgi:hypothetical protein